MHAERIPGAVSARVSPNPLNPEATLAFSTARTGFVKVRMFDLNGRLVRTLMDEAVAEAGEHRVRIESRGAHGESLASGVYFYRIETPEGIMQGRFTVLK